MNLALNNYFLEQQGQYLKLWCFGVNGFEQFLHNLTLRERKHFGHFLWDIFTGKNGFEQSAHFGSVLDNFSSSTWAARALTRCSSSEIRIVAWTQRVAHSASALFNEIFVFCRSWLVLVDLMDLLAVDLEWIRRLAGTVGFPKAIGCSFVGSARWNCEEEYNLDIVWTAREI